MANSSGRANPGVGAVISKVDQIRELVLEGRTDPAAVFARLRELASSEQWQTREVAATALVEIGKRQPTAVVEVARRWAKDRDPNIRRAASEGLRGIVKENPEAVLQVLALLRTDGELYVKKSVANVLRNGSSKHPELVLRVCRQWARSPDPHTLWIVKDGLRKLKATHTRDVASILAATSVHPG